MKISTKVSLYTGITTLLVGALILGYFLALLPGLYVDFKMKEEFRYMGYLLDSHQQDVADRKPVLSNLNYIIAKLSETEDRIILDTSYGRSEVVVHDSDMKAIISDIRDLAKKLKEVEEKEIPSILDEYDFDKYISIFRNKLGTETLKSMFSIENIENFFPEEDMVFQEVSYTTPAGGIVSKTQLTNPGTEISNYFGFSVNQNQIVFVIGTSITPHLYELLPVIVQSMPMIIALLILFSLLIAFLFSKILVKPIEKLAFHAIKMKELENAELISLNRHDEFSILEETLNQLYLHLQNMILSEKQQNEKLKSEYERQELFWIHSSHQLKTPISAAMLLVESMLLKIGKYKDTEIYLPRVKDELIHMQKIVYEMLDLYRLVQTELEMQNIQLSNLFSAALTKQDSIIQEKHLVVTVSSKICDWHTDEEILFRIIEHGIENAVKYSPVSGKIQIFTDEDKFQIINICNDIDSRIMENVFSPFVTSSRTEKMQSALVGRGHGLGLYMTSYYANLLDLDVSLENENNKIIFTCRIKKNRKEKRYVNNS